MTTSAVRATTETGRTFDDPSHDALRLLVQDVDAGVEEFVIVERLSDESGHTYMQTRLESDGVFVVEHRAGGPDEHYCAQAVGVETTHELLWSWVRDESQWRDSVLWTRDRVD